MRRMMFSLVVTTVLVAGCSQSDSEPAASDPSASTTSPSPSTDAPAPSDAGPEGGTDTDDTDPAESGTDTEAPQDGLSVQVTRDGAASTLAFTAVYCDGPAGSVRRVVAKTGERPPLIVAVPDRLVVLKLGDQRPARAERPTGVSYDDDSVTFADVRLSGGVALDGTLVCTER